MNQHHKDSHTSGVGGILPSAVWRSFFSHSHVWLVSLIFGSSVFLSGCSNDHPPQEKVTEAEPAPKPTFDSRLVEVNALTAFGTYYEALTSYPPRYRCTVRILNKTSHSIRHLVLVDCGSPPQTLMSAWRWVYSKTDVNLDPCLRPGEEREISYKIEFDSSNGGHCPSKDGPMVESITDTNGITFYKP